MLKPLYKIVKRKTTFMSLRLYWIAFLLLWGSAHVAMAQRIAKYGSDFLAGGVGARALGMGGAYTALTTDVTAGYWNPAGLNGLAFPELAYMHAERFAGVVSFDYAGIAFPVSARSTVGISLIRSGVNDIKNTLDAWDATRNLPKPNPEIYFRTFSAADYALFLSYAKMLSSAWSVGISGKIVRRTIGEFADAWGYSIDVGIRLHQRNWLVGAVLQDATTLLQSWSVNKEALRNLVEVFEGIMPEGGTELTLPVLRLGGAYHGTYREWKALVSMDLALAFDGQKTYALNTGMISYHPRLGAEVSFRDQVALRMGMHRLIIGPEGWSVSPTVGAGIHLRQFYIDYGFGNFAGLPAELGFSHRISLRVELDHPRWKRKPE